MKILQFSRLTATCVLIVAAGSVFAQGNPTMMDQATSGNANASTNPAWQPSLVRDGAYDRTAHIVRNLEWQPLREADVMWKKRVWREIDTREKQNQAFVYPGDDETGGGYFIEILLDAVKKGKLKAYSTFDDRFTIALNKDQIIEMLVGKADTSDIEDAVTGKISKQISHRDFDPLKVTKYRVKEDWMFDRNLGRMVVRIIGIAPLIDKYSDNGDFRASAPLMWIYYPEARPIFAQYEVFNPENDVQRMNWDDFWEGRYWSGHIIQVSNGFNESFKNAAGNSMTNMELLYEGQQAAEDVFNKEHDMWVY